MNRRNFITTATLVTAGAVLAQNAFAAHDGKIGTIDAAEWTKINLEAGEKVKAIKPGAEKLSDADQKLMLEIAAGGMMQLELSKAALAKATSADVKAYAQAETDEQTGLAAKLKEIAGVKGGTLPETPDDKTKKAVEKLNAKSGEDFDREYLQESGVDGHQKLEKTMSKVESKATDATLKTVASIALPLIKTHLQAARDEMKDKG
ncbi:MAG: putative rane protein [Chthoniobacter sp.]|jgi:putative membrane protein|nr:putative rane protein [Chthoniobacter sp.]